MSNNFKNCPAGSVFPRLLGFANLTDSSYPASGIYSLKIQPVSMSSSYVLSGGIIWPKGDSKMIPDVELDLCEGIGCQQMTDWGGKDVIRGIIVFHSLHDYNAVKVFVTGRSDLATAATFAKFIELDKSSSAMTSAQQSWGLGLSSGEEIEVIGAVNIELASSTRKMNKSFLRMFAVVKNLASGDFDVKWRAQILYRTQPTSVIDFPGNRFFDMKFIGSNSAGSPLNLYIAVSLEGSDPIMDSQVDFISNAETRAPTIQGIDEFGLNSGGSSSIVTAKTVLITNRGRIIVAGANTVTEGPMVMVFTQASPNSSPAHQLIFRPNPSQAGTNMIRTCLMPDESDESTLICVIPAGFNSALSVFKNSLFFLDPTKTSWGDSPPQGAYKGAVEVGTNSDYAQATSSFAVMECEKTNCFLISYAQKTASQQVLFLINFTLNSSMSGIASIVSTQKVGAPQLSIIGSEFIYSTVRFKNGSPQAIFSIISNKVVYSSGNEETDYGSDNKVISLVSTGNSDCLGILEPTAATVFTTQPGTTLATQTETLSPILRTQQTAVFESDDYHYKIYRWHMSSAGEGKLAYAPYFQCKYGDLEAAAGIFGATHSVDPRSGEDQDVHLITLTSVENDADGRVCNADRPIRDATRVTASYEGGPGNASLTALDFSKTRSIYSEVDCESAGVSNATECAAYTVLTQLTKLLLPNYPNKYDFTSTVPAMRASYIGLKVKVSDVTFNFEQWQSKVLIDWTVSYPGGDVADVQAQAEAALAQAAASAGNKYADLLGVVDTENTEQISKQEQTPDDSDIGEAAVEVNQEIKAESDSPSLDLSMLDDAISKTKVLNAFADLLRVEGADQILAEAQDTLKFSDDTDFEAAAQNDIESWLQDSGLSEKYSSENQPSALLYNAMKADFAVPRPGKMSSRGGLGLNFNNPIKVVDPRKSFLTLRSLQDVTEESNDEGAGKSDAEIVTRLEEMEAFLKLTGSIKTLLVPSNENYTDKKKYEWKLTHYDEKGIGFRVEFENPIFVSSDEPDTLFITFFNTDQYLAPQSETLSSIPDGFKLSMKIPPQGGAEILSETELTQAQSEGQQIVIIQLLISLLLGQVLAAVFGSILVVQIMAHLPMTDVYLSANVLQKFQIMISIVSFDYFPPFEYIDAGFTEVWAFSPQFEWVGYDTVNFLLGLGSIAVFAALQILKVVIMLLKTVTRINCPCKSLENSFSGATTWSESLTLIHGTFFEFTTCGITAMTMLPYRDQLNELDNYSVYLAIGCLVILSLYLLFITYFAFCRSGDLLLKRREKIEEQNLQRCKQIHSYIIMNGSQDKNWDEDRLAFAQQTLEKSLQEREKRIERASRMSEASFVKFEPLVDGSRPTSRMSLLGGFLLNVRRIIMLCLAMTVVGYRWIQMQVFITMNFMAFVHAFVVRPFEETHLNLLNIVNELFGVLLSYLLLILQDPMYTPEEHEQIGEYIIYLIYVQGLVNLLIIAFVTFKDLWLKLKQCFVKCKHCCKQKQQTSKRRQQCAAEEAKKPDQPSKENVDYEPSSENHDQVSEEEKSAPSDSAPSDSAPSDSAPSDSAPSDSAPSDSAPSDSAPSDSADAQQAKKKDTCSEISDKIDTKTRLFATQKQKGRLLPYVSSLAKKNGLDQISELSDSISGNSEELESIGRFEAEMERLQNAKKRSTRLLVIRQNGRIETEHKKV